jgi:hypothetical protein
MVPDNANKKTSTMQRIGTIFIILNKTAWVRVATHLREVITKTNSYLLLLEFKSFDGVCSDQCILYIERDNRPSSWGARDLQVTSKVCVRFIRENLMIHTPNARFTQNLAFLIYHYYPRVERKSCSLLRHLVPRASINHSTTEKM